ncbi:MAG: hypothetical protein ABJC39_01805 [Chloroflexota bacterium]
MGGVSTSGVHGVGGGETMADGSLGGITAGRALVDLGASGLPRFM